MGEIEVQENQGQDLAERTFQFSVGIVKLVRFIGFSKENDVIKYQLVKSATSIGANYEEAQGAHSRDDFKYKIGICFREARESSYWLRIIKEVNIIDNDKLAYFLNECEELKKIFAAIFKKIRYRKTF